MAEWIHCNKCFFRYATTIKFYVTTCGHLNCENCVSKIGPEKQCLVCSSVCDTVQLSNNLKPDIQWFFRPYAESSEKRKQIFTFHYGNTVALLNNIIEKYTIAKSEITRYYKAAQDIKKQNAQLRQMILSSVNRWEVPLTTLTPGVASTSMTAPPAITPISQVSNKCRQTESSHTTFMPWNQPKCAGRTPNQQRNVQRTHSYSSHLVPTFEDSVASPAVSNGGISPLENPTMVSMSRLGFGSNRPF